MTLIASEQMKVSNLPLQSSILKTQTIAMLRVEIFQSILKYLWLYKSTKRMNQEFKNSIRRRLMYTFAQKKS